MVSRTCVPRASVSLGPRSGSSLVPRLGAACGSVLMAGACLGPTPAASANPPFDKNFDVAHRFNVFVNSPGGNVWQGGWTWNVHAHTVRNNQNDPGNPDNQGQLAINFPPAVFAPAPVTVTSKALNPTIAQANAQAQANDQGAVFNRVWGGCSVGPPAPGLFANARASASSTVSYRTGTLNRQGHIAWSPQWHYDSVAGGSGGIVDPLAISWRDLTTNGMLFDTLWDVQLLVDGAGAADAGNGALSLSGVQTGSLRIDMTSPYLTSPQGSLFLAFSGGVVTTSTSTGLWAGQIPGVGASPNFSMPFGNGAGAFDLAFNYGGSSPNGYEFNVGTGGSGEAELTIVPAPGGLVLLLGAVCCGRRSRRRFSGYQS
jgi:hypothetical protein